MCRTGAPSARCEQPCSIGDLATRHLASSTNAFNQRACSRVSSEIQPHGVIVSSTWQNFAIGVIAPSTMGE